MTFSLIEKSAMSGLDISSPSSEITIGFVAVPSFSSTTVAGSGSPAFRQVACRAKQARCGAIDETEAAVEIEEMDEARDDRDLSEIIDSGLERVDAALAIDGRLEFGRKPAKVSIAQRLKPDF